ncbi:MAG TPA: hypothetical protein VIY50_06915 [Steroidobacteraceae bacterium]
MSVRTLALGLLLLLPCMDAAATQTPAVIVEQNEAMATLTGPWRFRIGDNPAWADPGGDDSDWEQVDLSAPASATDGDVGLPHYTAGWAARGHPGYFGYAWYRLHLSLQTPARERLALLGPWQVDSTYQVYANGRLLGGVGDFSGTTPIAYGYHYPTFFTLPSPTIGSSAMVIAIRVWMGPWGLDDPQGGGIHIAPAIGARSAIAARYHLQWLKIFAGYAVDAIPALLLFSAVIVVLCLLPFDRGGSTYRWLAAALLLSGIQRGNQPFFFWLQIETIREFVIFIIAVTGSLSLGAWMMAWRAWFKVTRPGWLPQAAAALTLALAMTRLLAEPWMFNVGFPPFVGVGVHYLITALRLAFLLMFVLIAYQGIRAGRGGWHALLAVLAIGTALFSAELSALHIPGIWFPWGVGVSLSECASVVFVLLLFALLLRRLWSYSDRRAFTADT